MEIVITGRGCEISERFREHVDDKLARIERYEQRQRLSRLEVEVTVEQHSQPDRVAQVELTLRSKGPVVRAEAHAADKSAALAAAIDKLEARLRKAADRRRVHRGQHRPMSVSEHTAGLLDESAAATSEEPVDEATTVHHAGPIEVVGDGPLVVREKTHSAAPMTLDQALYEMEMVGHDFYLFVDRASGCPSVVYRRRGYDYGVIQLDSTPDDADLERPAAAAG